MVAKLLANPATLPDARIRLIAHRASMDAAVRSAGVALDRIVAVLPMVVGKRVSPPDGTWVGITVTGPAARRACRVAS